MLLPRFCLLAVLAISLASISRSARAADNAYGVEAYTIIDNQTGHVLDSFEGSKKRQVASLTKIATAMVVLDWCRATNHEISELVVIPEEVARMEGANPVGLLPGDFVSVRDLLYCSLLQSDNMAAYALASHVGRFLKSTPGSRETDLSAVDTFVAQMNALARSLKMEKTLFLNPNGLEPRKGTLPFSTSHDMAALTRYALNDKGFLFYVSQRERKISITRMMQPIGYLLKNTNELLGENGIDGVKTGRTTAAGECLILSSAQAPETREEGGKTYVTPRRVTVVLLGARDRFFAGRQLVSRAWALEQQWAAEGRRMPENLKSTSR